MHTQSWWRRVGLAERWWNLLKRRRRSSRITARLRMEEQRKQRSPRRPHHQWKREHLQMRSKGRMAVLTPRAAVGSFSRLYSLTSPTTLSGHERAPKATTLSGRCVHSTNERKSTLMHDNYKKNKTHPPFSPSDDDGCLEVWLDPKSTRKLPPFFAKRAIVGAPARIDPHAERSPHLSGAQSEGKMLFVFSFFFFFYLLSHPGTPDDETDARDSGEKQKERKTNPPSHKIPSHYRPIRFRRGA